MKFIIGILLILILAILSLPFRIARYLFNLIFRKSRKEQTTLIKNGGVEAVNPDGVIIAKLDMDDFSDGERQNLWSLAREISNLPLYEGHIEHGYGLDFVSTSQQCPRCRAATQQHYANFIYATQTAPRVMFTPAGYFCTKCPTVIIDEDMIRSAVDKRFHFQGVLGLDYDRRGKPDFLVHPGIPWVAGYSWRPPQWK